MIKAVCLFFILSFSAIADDVGILSTTQKGVTDGEIVTLKVIDSRDLKYFSQYNNKRIGSLIYVINTFEKENEIYFEAIISQMGQKEKPPKLADNFILKGLNYYPSKNKPLMDFITLNIPIDVKKNMPMWLIILLAFILIAFSYWWFSTKSQRRREKLKKIKLKARADELLGLIQKADSKKDYSKIYILRSEITQFLEYDNSEFNKIMKHLDSIQYQKSWPEEDFNLIKKNFKKIKDDIKVKSGI